MFIKIIPREKVYFRDWVEKNGIEVEVRELEDGVWEAEIVNCRGNVTKANGSSQDDAITKLSDAVSRRLLTRKDSSPVEVIDVPKFDNPSEKPCRTATEIWGDTCSLAKMIEEDRKKAKGSQDFSRYVAFARRDCGCLGIGECMGH